MSSSSQTTNQELEQVLLEVERSLDELQQRHAQVKQDLQTKNELLVRQQELEQQDKSSPDPIKTELRHLKQQVEELEFNLESSLLPNLFWQVVRFVGLGIIIGWLLHTLAN